MKTELPEVGVDEKHGDTELPAHSFAEFYVAEYAATKRLAHLLSGSAAAAEDITQGAFEAIYPRFERIEHPAAYLRAVTVNQCRRTYRRASGERDRLTLIGFDDVVLPSDGTEIRPR